MTIIEALSHLAVALGCCTEITDMKETTIAGAIKFIADNYTPGT